MLIDKGVFETFKSSVDFTKVPSRPLKPRPAQVVFIRPPLDLPGYALIVYAEPSKRALYNHLISKLLFLRLSSSEREFLLAFTSVELASREKTFFRTVFDLLQHEDVFSKARLSLRKLIAQGLKEASLLPFLPSEPIARNSVALKATKRWYRTPKVILPQRKRGYDDKGHLSPPDSINWREVALANAVETASLSNSDVEQLLGRIRVAWGVRTDETAQPDRLIEPVKVETVIRLALEKGAKK
jgi:hypothetical protein